MKYRTLVLIDQKNYKKIEKHSSNEETKRFSKLDSTSMTMMCALFGCVMRRSFPVYLVMPLPVTKVIIDY